MLRVCKSAQLAEGTPVQHGAPAPAPPKTPWRTPPPTFAEVATPATAAPASGWQAHYDDATAMDAGTPGH